jgi:methionyl-tRNA formyltransferase
MLGELLKEGESGIARAKPQDESKATYAPPIKKEEGELILNAPAEINFRKVLALAENPGTFFTWKDQKFKVNNSEIRDGKFRITILTPPGKRKMAMEDYQRGNPAFREEEL